MVKEQLNLEIIQEAMRNQGLNQSDISRHLGVSRESISKWLNNESVPRANNLLKLGKLLRLPYSDIMRRIDYSVPIIEFRTHRNKAVSPQKKLMAEDLARSVALLGPYLPKTPTITKLSHFSFAEYASIQKTASYFRSLIGTNNGVVEILQIIELCEQFNIVLVPVLWGTEGDNGLFVYLPDNNVSFIYLNLETNWVDAKFWLLHEFAHIMIDDSPGSSVDIYADALAQAILFPESEALVAYEELSRHTNKGAQINILKEYAHHHGISLHTVYNAVNEFAKAHQKPLIQLNVGGAANNFAKETGLLSTVLFKAETPTPFEYIQLSKRAFSDTFFSALAHYLKESNAGSGIVSRMMNIPSLDAKGVHQALVADNDFT